MKNQNLEIIKDKDKIIAIIVRKDFHEHGVSFFSPEDFSQQIGSICQPKGHIIGAHTHRLIKREIYLTQEVLIIRRGKIKVNLYNAEKKYIGSRILNAGDIILIAYGGHGYEVLEDIDMIEIKQGPYLGKDDKLRFNGKENQSQ